MSIGRVTPWSYSSLNDYETCPRRYYLTRIAKVVTEKATEARTAGNEVHKALELYVGGKAPLPDKYVGYKALADRLRTTPGEKRLEWRFALNRQLNPTSFFAKDCWVRGVLDVTIVRQSTALVFDYKTGKRKLDGDQLRLFAGAALSLLPTVKRVKTGYIWLQSEQIDSETFVLQDKVTIFQDFAARVHRMELSERDGKWPAKPSGLCRNWCPVGQKLCEHCGT